MGYVKLVGTKNPNTDWTTEVVLEKDGDGNPTRVLRAGVPSQISAEEQEQLEEQGLVFENSSKKEAEEAQQEAAAVAGSDVGGSAPVFGSGADQDNDD